MAAKLKDTKQRIMDVARLTVQARGYAGLNFREIAAEIGVKSASIHYHFPTKGELGGALARQYTADFLSYLDGLLADGMQPDICLKKYIEVFRYTLSNENRMCLGGIMAAEYEDLPAQVRVELLRFSDLIVGWIARVLTIQNKRQPGDKATHRHALAIFAAIQGAQLVARGRGDIAIYDEIIKDYRAAKILP